MNYLCHIAVMICLYIMLAESLNVVMGYTGMMSLCHAAFYGLGAYASTLLMVKAGWSFLPALVGTVILTGFFAWALSHPSIGFHDDFFVLVTLGMQMIVFYVLYNWTGFTGGSFGISRIPRPALAGFAVGSQYSFAILAGLSAAGVLFIVHRLMQSPYGRTLQAVRDDEMAACSLGKDAAYFKRSAFVIGGVLAALPGVLFAGYSGYIDPTSFTIDESIFIACVVIIGGAGNVRGPAVGAIILVLLPEILRFIPMPDSVAANMRQIIYGLLLVALMRFRPQGIAGRYAFD